MSEQPQAQIQRLGSGSKARWVCICRDSPVLLATIDEGMITIKTRTRQWTVNGAVRTECPRCHAEYHLDPAEVDFEQLGA